MKLVGIRFSIKKQAVTIGIYRFISNYLAFISFFSLLYLLQIPTYVIIYALVDINGGGFMEREKTSRGITKAMEVEPLKNIKDIEKIKQYLKGKDNKRDYMLFSLGINVGLRASDLLNIKIKDVYINGEIIDKVFMQEKKTKKFRTFTLNERAKEVIKIYLDTLTEINPERYLFKSRKGDGPLTVSATHRIIKTITRDLNIKGNYGTHSLRKTWAYHIYINNNDHNPMILPTLQKALNHSSQAMTLCYIGITSEVISDLYTNLNL